MCGRLEVLNIGQEGGFSLPLKERVAAIPKLAGLLSLETELNGDDSNN